MPTLLLQNITKQFPGVIALDDVTISVAPGEIHALCGENGAGKSTLMNILSGNLQPDGGDIIIDGSKAIVHDPQQAFDQGIAIVYQHLSLVDSLNVAENIYANRQPKNKAGIIQFRELHFKTQALLRRLNLEGIDPWTQVGKLSPAQKQMVEIAKALSRDPSIFILDEPTTSLTHKETKTLFEILRAQRNKGTSVIYISHRLEEIFLLADRVSVLKDGRYQGTFDVKDLNRDALISKMVGRKLKELRSGSNKDPEVLFKVENISGGKFTDITFDLHRGEILGLSGLVGAGRTEIARSIFGKDRISAGEMYFRDVAFRPFHPHDAVKKGIAYVTEDRKTLGLFSEMSVMENIVAAGMDQVMPSRLHSDTIAEQVTVAARKKLSISMSSPKQRIGKLSGGNQQKAMLAKWLLIQPEILIVDEPTQGIDIGAKYEIYDIMKEFVATGKAIIMISSELPELIGLCDRIIVIKRGRIAGVLSGNDRTEEKIMELAT